MAFYITVLNVEITHPRKGTETLDGNYLNLLDREITHPRKGTETGPRAATAPLPRRNNSPPQGDGNISKKARALKARK